MSTCPSGHPAGTKWESRTCSEFVCGEFAPKGLTSKAAAKDLALSEIPAEPKGKRLKAEEVPEALRARHEMFLERAKVAGLPAAIAGDKALEWSQQKLVEMLPEAIASLQWDLRYGSAKERGDAVQSVLKANGVAQKEAAVGSAPTIVLHLGDGDSGFPFLQRTAAAAKKGKS